MGRERSRSTVSGPSRRWRGAKFGWFYSSPSLRRGPGQRLPDFDVRTCITNEAGCEAAKPRERANERVRERASSRVRAKIHFAQERDAVRPSPLLVGRYEGAVKRKRGGGKIKNQRAPPSRGREKKARARGERRIRDKAQKRWPGKTGRP